MSDEKTRELLAELRQELQAAGELDPAVRQLLKEINSDLDKGNHVSTLERAKELETRFAANHPVAERIARVIIDSLGKMGI
ncbi:MAG: DUF4404 family protein [Woeseiaceae bacterium]|nr:DUF4404 family protein [Woeseiaceae bacterium]